MLNAFLRALFKALLSLRYRIRIEGLDQLAKMDDRGMLFLPNHPALIDPFILLCFTTARFPVRALAGRGQIDKPGIRWLASRIQVRKIPDAHERSGEVKHQIASMLRNTARALNSGEALVLYPAGRIYRRNREDLGNNGAVAFLVENCPNIRVVLVRTTGLWGSSFSRASGPSPSIAAAVKRGLFGLLKSGLLFAPRRHIRIEFSECTDFPRGANRDNVNRYLERHYNAIPMHRTYVPYSIWEQGGTRTLPEPDGDGDAEPPLG